MRNTGNISEKLVLEVGPGEGPDAVELAHQGEKPKSTLLKPTAGSCLIPPDLLMWSSPRGFWSTTNLQIPCWPNRYGLLNPEDSSVDVPQLFSPQAISKALLMRMGKWPYGWERNYTEEQLISLMKRHGLKIVDHYAWGFLPTLNLGIRTRLRKSFSETRKLATAEHRSWLARHSLNCIGIVGQKT